MIARLADIEKINSKRPEKKKKTETEEDEENAKARIIVSLNPYSGQILGPWNMESDFLHTVEKIHKTWNEAHINFAKNLKDPIRVNLRYPYQIVRKQNTFEFNQYSGKLLKSEYFKDYSAADKVKHANRTLHTGQAFGLFGKIIMFFASLFSATLPVSGFLVWYQKKGKKSNKKQPIRIPATEPIAKTGQKRKPVMQPRIAQQV